MATTMNLIAKQTVGSGGAATVTFSNIPQTFTDIKVVMSTRNNNASGSYFNISFNGVTTNRSNVRLYSNGSVTASYSGSDLFVYSDYASRTANTFDNIEMYIPNYTSSNYKSISIDDVTENNASGAEMALLAGLWSSTAAITSISFTPDAGSFDQYTTFYLYGISNSSTQNTSVPLASGGDVIATDGTYWFHTFLNSGTFTPLKNLTCDYLVVAGGAGGGYSQGGGAGAGGLRSTVTATGGGGSLETALALTANTVYTATVGAGGAGATSSQSYGANGGNSVFASITSIGGGGGGTGGVAGQNGGSGGGTGGNGSSAGGTGTANQGYAGGTAYTGGNYYGGGGGGGAGAVGQNGSSGSGGNGGNGVAVAISGSSVTYAGGGGGSTFTGGTYGTGGTGGGGRGGNYATGEAGQPGTANTGGGGGGSGYGPNFPGSAGPGGAGGSGIIVVRYPVL